MPRTRIETRLGQQTRRAAGTTRRKIGSSAPEGLEGTLCPHCGAVAGKSSHGPMT